MARLSPGRDKPGRDAEEDVDEQDEIPDINIQDLRTKIDKEVEKQRWNEVGTRSMLRIIQKFESKLEAAVQRMARLGMIDEELEEYEGCQEMNEMELSLADEAVNNVSTDLPTETNMSVAEVETNNVKSEINSDEMNLSVAVQKDFVARLSVAELSAVKQSVGDQRGLRKETELNLSVAVRVGEISKAEGETTNVEQGVAELSVMTGAKREPDNQRGLSLETELHMSGERETPDVNQSVAELSTVTVTKAEGVTQETFQGVAELRVMETEMNLSVEGESSYENQSVAGLSAVTVNKAEGVIPETTKGVAELNLSVEGESPDVNKSVAELSAVTVTKAEGVTPETTKGVAELRVVETEMNLSVEGESPDVNQSVAELSAVTATKTEGVTQGVDELSIVEAELHLSVEGETPDANQSVAELSAVTMTIAEVKMMEGETPEIYQGVAELSVENGAEMEPENQRENSLGTEFNLSVEGETPDANQCVAELSAVILGSEMKLSVAKPIAEVNMWEGVKPAEKQSVANLSRVIGAEIEPEKEKRSVARLSSSDSEQPPETTCQDNKMARLSEARKEIAMISALIKSNDWYIRNNPNSDPRFPKYKFTEPPPQEEALNVSRGSGIQV